MVRWRIRPVPLVRGYCQLSNLKRDPTREIVAVLVSDHSLYIVGAWTPITHVEFDLRTETDKTGAPPCYRESSRLLPGAKDDSQHHLRACVWASLKSREDR